MIEITNIENLMKLNISNWKYNRPVNRTRIPHIMEYIKKYRRVEGIIYLAKKDNVYFCYDGIHRYNGIKKLIKEQQEYFNMLGTHDVLQIKLVIDIMPYDEKSIQERFININSSLPVPTMYTDSDRRIDKLDITEKVFDYIHTTYSSFIKASRKTNIPNTNSTQFAEKFNSILDVIHHYDIEYWIRQFELFNTFMKSRDIKTRISKKDEMFSTIKLSSAQERKCSDYDFYCFAASNWEDYFMFYLESKEIKQFS